MINRIIFVVCLFLGTLCGGFLLGKHYTDSKYAALEKKQIQVVVKKNDSLQTVSNKTEEAVVIYKDRIVTKYQTVTKEVVKYVERENSNPADVIWLDSSWIRVHDDAANAANGEDASAGTTTIANDSASETKKVGVKSGAVLDIVSQNYQAYANCRVQLTGLQQYILDLNKEFNK